MLECNYLTMLMKPNFEKPVDTPQDIINMNLTVIDDPGNEREVERLKNFNGSKIIRELAKRTIVPKVIYNYFEKKIHFNIKIVQQDYYESEKWLDKKIQKTGSAVVQVSFLYPWELKLGKFYRSKEKKEGQSPFSSYYMNKKWTLEEEFNKHMLVFQQVTVSTIFFGK